MNITPGFGTADISILNIIGIEASAIGNHEFDAGTNPFAAIMRQTTFDPDGSGPLPARTAFPGAQFPYLSANLDFSLDTNLNPLFTSAIQDAENYTGFSPPAGIGKKIAPATIINENGEKIGVVGATTQIVESISSTGGVDVIGDDVNDMAALAAILQPTIDQLLAAGNRQDHPGEPPAGHRVRAGAGTAAARGRHHHRRRLEHPAGRQPGRAASRRHR